MSLIAKRVAERLPIFCMQLKLDFGAEESLNFFGVFKSESYDWLWVKESRM